MKLMQIDLFANSGSTGRIAEQIGRHVITNGWESIIAYGRSANKSENKLIKIGNKLDMLAHGVLTRIFDNHSFGLSSRKATINFVKEIDKNKPDLIHIHNSHGYYLNNEILFNYLSRKQIPIVWTQHDCWAFTGHCTHFDFVGCEKWKTQCFQCEQKSEYPKSLIFDRSLQNYNIKKKLFNSLNNLTIVSVSNWLSDRVKESYLKNHNSKVIYNGVDLKLFYPKNSRDIINNKYNLNGRYLLLGVATTWNERKGLQDFLKLSKLLDNTFIIVLIGLDKNQIKNLPENIIGIERTESQEELCSFYSSADLFLNLSFEETFGLTTAEALACGVPSVVYNVTACPELISNETGFVVESQNIKQLFNTIKQARNIGKSKFTNACRNRAISLFDKNRLCLEYFNLYNKILINNEKK